MLPYNHVISKELVPDLQYTATTQNPQGISHDHERLPGNLFGLELIPYKAKFLND